MSDPGNIAQPVAEPLPEPAVEPELAPSEGRVAESPSAAPTEVEADGDSASEASKLSSNTDEPGLLSGVLEAVKTEEPEKPKADGEAKPIEAPVIEPAALEPIAYEPFTLPEGVTLNDEGLGKFTSLVGEKLRLPQEAAQDLMDLGIEEIQRVREHESAEQHRIFGETRRSWRNEIMGDEELGGAGFETNRAAAMRMKQLFVPEERRQQFEDFLVVTGAADNPEFFRFLVNLARKFDEPSPSPVPRNPPPNIGRNPSGGRRINYDNPTSPRRNGT